MPSAREIGGKEQILLLRRFGGVNIAIDAAFVDPSFLQISRNWVPGQTYLLTKRQGTVFFGNPKDFFGQPRVDICRLFTDANGVSYVFYMVVGGLNEHLEYMTSDGVAHLVANAGFATTNGRYGMTVLGNDLYVGNGIDPIKQIPLTLPFTAVDLVPLPAAVDTGQTAVVSANVSSTLLSGTYFYRWAIFDTLLKAWISVGPVEMVQVVAGQQVTFTAPTAAAGTNRAWHLFVSVANAPIEDATDQTPNGLAAAATVILADLTITGGLVPIPSTVMRTGRYFVSHLNRVWFAVGTHVYATDVIVPGLEQNIFDAGTFFPALAQFGIEDDAGTTITGLGIATATGTQDTASSPVIVFTESQCWAWFGDIVNDSNALRVKLSGRVGCIAAQTIVNTPLGMIFVGLDTVYIINPNTLVPQDIGWPIAPAIKAIPFGRRSFATAIFHKGFYKLALTPPGGSQNTIQFWLDLRQATINGALDQVPSWWGDHSHLPLASMCVDVDNAHEFDRGIGFAEGPPPGPTSAGGLAFLLDQAGVYKDGQHPRNGGSPGTVINSLLLTKQNDNGAPFDDKIVTRVQVNGDVPIRTQLALDVIVDGVGESVPPLIFPDPGGAIWNVSAWNVSDWGVPTFEEALSTMPADRPRGREITVRVRHPDPTIANPIVSGVDLRDFALVFLQVARKVPTFPPVAP